MLPEASSRRTVAACGVALLAALLLLPLLPNVWLPYAGAPEGVVSASTLEREHPLSDYLRYALLLGAPLALGLAVLRLRRSVAEEVARGALLAGFLVVAGSWLVNSAAPGRAGELDAFHEGEQLAFLPAFLRSTQPFRDTFFIHGFGIDALPSLAADALGGGIGIERAVVAAETGLVGAILLWTLWELVASFRLVAPRAAFAAAAVVVFLRAGDPGQTPLELYLALPLAQIALALRFRRTRGPRHRTALAVAAGVLLPLGLFWSYSGSVYGAAVWACAAGIAICSGRRSGLVWLGGGAGGAAAALALLLPGIDPPEFGAVLGQLRYWSVAGGWIWDLPLPATEFGRVSDLWDSPLVLAVLAQLTAALVLAGRWRGLHSAPMFAAANAPLLLFLVGSLVVTKEALGRSDSPHLARAELPALLLLLAVGLAALEQLGDARSSRRLAVAVVVAAVALPGASLASVSIGQANVNGSALLEDVARTDAEIVGSDYSSAADTVRRELASDACFYTLTSEGVWYYLLERPSCSRFHQLAYARTQAAQEEVRRDLERKAPPLLLFSSENWDVYDGLTPAATTPTVHRSVLDRYRPSLLVGRHWFWRLAAEPLRAGAAAAPLPGRAAGEVARPGGEAIVRGWSRLPRQSSAQQAVYARIPALGPQPLAVARARPEKGNRWKWTLRVPTAGLPAGPHTVELWAYDARTDRLVRIAATAELDVLPD